MAVLEDVKKLLGDIEGKDALLTTIVTITENRLRTLLGEEEVPSELDYITTEVSVSRFNKIGSEGVSSHSVDGESLSFNANDFSPYENDISAWKEAHTSSSIGKVRFI